VTLDPRKRIRRSAGTGRSGDPAPDRAGRSTAASPDAAVAVSKAYGVETMFTLSGGHVFPLYDGAVHEGVRILDVRHEQSAVFAAEATARLTRTPGATWC